MAEAKKTTTPAKKEAEGEDIVTLDVEINGRTISLQAPADIMKADAEAYVAFEERKFGVMLKALLGEQQWLMLRGAGMSTELMMDQVLGSYQEAAGLGEG